MSSNQARSIISLIIPPVLGLSAGLAILYGISLNMEPGNKPEEFALGEETSTYWAQVDGLPVHCSSPSEGLKCIEAYEKYGLKKDVVLSLRNIQIH